MTETKPWNLAKQQPVFANAVEQTMWYVRRFVKFCVEILKEAGKKIPDDERVDAVLDAIPAEIIMTYLLEVDQRYGDKLDAEDLKTVAQLVALYSPTHSMHEMLRDMTEFTRLLEEKPELKKKFFLYWRVIKQIIISTTKDDGRSKGTESCRGGNK